MVIRRIRQHVESHNWFAVGVDFAIVVIGVFIGVQATIWNEGRIERQQSDSYRTRLIDELDFNERQFRQQLAYYQQVRQHGLALLQRLQSPASGSDRDLLIDAYQSTHIDIVPPKRFIYDELLSAGLVDRLGNEEMQAIASDYYLSNEARDRTLAEIFPYRTVMRTLLPYPAQQRIRDGCGDILVYHQRRIIGVRLPQSCDVDLPAAVVAAGADRIRSSPGIVDDLTRYLSSLDEKLDALRGALSETAGLKAKLIETADS